MLMVLSMISRPLRPSRRPFVVEDAVSADHQVVDVAVGHRGGDHPFVALGVLDIAVEQTRVASGAIVACLAASVTDTQSSHAR